MNIENNFESIEKQALLKTEEMESDVKNIYNKLNKCINKDLSNLTNEELLYLKQIISNNSVILYDKSSVDESINWNYLNGIGQTISAGTTIFGKNFNPYSRLRIYCLSGQSNWETNWIFEVDLKQMSSSNDYRGSFVSSSKYAPYTGNDILTFTKTYITINREKTTLNVQFCDSFATTNSYYYNRDWKIYKIEGVL